MKVTTRYKRAILPLTKRTLKLRSSERYSRQYTPYFVVTPYVPDESHVMKKSVRNAIADTMTAAIQDLRGIPMRRTGVDNNGA
jgi:hypothetical protein